jgi:hypothetical protein
MALLTLANLLNAVLDEIPGKEQAPIVRAANKVVRRIQSEHVSPVRSTFTTKAPVTTGTVAVTQDSTTVTFSSSILSATDPVMLLQVDGDSTWFVMTYASGTGGVLSSKWAEASDATATYTLVYPTVSFPAAVGQVTQIQQAGYQPLPFRMGESCPYTTGTPSSWSPYTHDAAAAAPSDDLLRYFLNPAPDQRLVFQFWYKPRTTFLDPGGATSQVIPLPDVWEEAVVQGTLYWLWQQEDTREKALLHHRLYEDALARSRGAQHGAITLEPGMNRRGLYGWEERPIQ